MLKFPTLRIPPLLLFSMFLLAGFQAFPQCGNPSYPQFANSSLESGSSGEVNAVYRFSAVLPGVDALVTIASRFNTSLISMDLNSSGAWDHWQPQINLDVQHNNGNTGYMDFDILFVNAGTSSPVTVSEVVMTAIDVDGDSYRLREGIGFSNVNTFELDIPTELVSYEGEQSLTMFDASTVANQEGISTTATEHMVTARSLNSSLISLRCQISADPSYSGWSNAPDRKFSFTFDPCVPDNFSTPNSFPVEMGEFVGTAEDGIVRLSWTTFSELNNDRFEVQRSDDGVVFYQIGEVLGHGTTDQGQQYLYPDYAPSIGANYYRLRQIDFDGQFQYSSVIEVTMDALTSQVNIWPNPAIETLHVRSNDQRQITDLQLLNLSGQECEMVYELVSDAEAIIELSENIPSGMYLLRHQLDGIWQKGNMVVIE